MAAIFTRWRKSANSNATILIAIELGKRTVKFDVVLRIYNEDMMFLEIFVTVRYIKYKKLMGIHL